MSPPCQIRSCLGSGYPWLCFASINTAQTYSLNRCANLRRENTSSVLEQCYFLPNSPECHWNWARLELHQLFMGLTLWNGVKMVSSFSTPRKGRSCFVFLQGNVPSEPGTTLFFEKHLQPFLSPTEGTPKLEIRDPSTFSCSGITLGMAWVGWKGLAAPALTEHGHSVTLRDSEWV